MTTQVTVETTNTVVEVTSGIQTEVNVSWVQGLPGPAGASGASGYSGYSGIGTSGFSGFSGFSGQNGSGISGYSGFSGSGLSGYSGFSGFSGESISGASGYSGFSGIGTSGFSGYSGFSGESIVGASGFSGYSGSGISGWSGFSGYSGIGTSGFSGFSGAVGAQGIQGESGFSGYSGQQGAGINVKGSVPTVGDLPSVGNQPNDAWIVNASGHLYIWTGSAWTDAGQFLGQSGFSGYSGSGVSGFSGFSGYSGESISGFSGFSGYSGESISGASGFSGFSGIGTSGFSGYSGYSGSGVSGFSGYSGFSGESISGFSGFSGYSGESISGFSGFSGFSGAQGASGVGGALGYWGSFWDTTDQVAVLANTAYPISLNSYDIENIGITVVSGSRVTFQNTGIYSLIFSIQFMNQDTQIQEVNVWFAKNGIALADSDSKLSVQQTHGGIHGFGLMTINYMLKLTAGDYIELMWNTTNTLLSIQSIPANTVPAIPGVILTAQQVMNTQSGYSGFSGMSGFSGVGISGYSGYSGSSAFAAEIKTPTNVSPTNGQTNIGATPTLTGSAFYSLYGIAMAAAQWQIATDSGFETLVLNTGDSSAAVTYNVASGVLNANTTYYWRVRYKDANGIYSDWSTGTSFTTAVSFGPTVIGQAYGGGYYAGKINVSGTQYYLIAAPKASGETTAQWKTSNTSTAGTSSVIDGPTNSANMNNATHPAAYFCEGLSIGGYTDWYFPAKNELEVMYYFLKPTTTANNTTVGANANAVSPEPISTNYTTGSPAQTSAADFITPSGTQAFVADTYWSSTEYSPTIAWFQNFNVGGQDYYYKDYTFYVRACRRLPV